MKYARGRYEKCPFCGSAWLEERQSADPDVQFRDGHAFYVVHDCQECGAEVHVWYRMTVVDVEAWKKESDE